MEKIELRACEDFAALERMAARCWHSAYDGLLGEKQVAYMLQKFQSAPAMGEQVRAQGYTYYFILCGERLVGYCGLQGQGKDLFLSKLYLAEEERGKGIGQAALSLVAEEARRRGAQRVYLTVNKHNARAVRAYEKFGFVFEKAQRTPSGEGYYMDDLVYAYRLLR